MPRWPPLKSVKKLHGHVVAHRVFKIEGQSQKLIPFGGGCSLRANEKLGLGVVFMAELSRESVKRIAELARLNLSEEEVTRAQSELVKILSAFDALSKIPLPPELAGQARSALAVHAAENQSDFGSRLRADVAYNSLTTQEFLNESPDTDSVFIRVPSILDRST